MNQLLLLTVLLLVAKSLLAQPQPQGEFHQQLFKKSDKRTKAFPEVGVIVFAAQEIPRLGTVKEIEPILGSEFRRYQSVWARFFFAETSRRIARRHAKAHYLPNDCRRQIALRKRTDKRLPTVARMVLVDDSTA